MNILVHFINQEQHSEIEFEMLIAEISQPIKEVTILSTEMNRNDITLILHTLGYKSFCPRKIMNLTIDSAGTKSCRIHKHMIVTLKSGFYHSREIATLLTCLIDGNAKRCKTWQIHQNIINQITEPAIIMAAYNTTESNTVSTTQRMIANESV